MEVEEQQWILQIHKFFDVSSHPRDLTLVGGQYVWIFAYVNKYIGLE